ncbi:MAG: SRPBCC domain-containing protein [Chloroflexota bacterium]
MESGFTLSTLVPARASDIYQAWLNSEGHAAMTGSSAHVDGNVGGKFSAWDGYICGSTLELTPNERIVQAWRTSEFPADAPDSRLDVYLEEVEGGTQITLTHSDLPDGQVDSYRQGWEDFYFKTMKKYFGG